MLLVLVCSIPARGRAEGGGAGPDAPAGKIEAVVTYLEGDVEIDGSICELGQIVPLGSTVKTGMEGSCEISFGEQNIFRIEEDTITTISIGSGERNISIEKGAIDAIFERLSLIGGDNDKFRIQTPSVVAGVRGTVFYIKVEDPNITYLCTCYGTIHQEPADGGSPEDVTSYHHAAYRYIKTPEGVKVEKAGLLYHDDEAMDGLGEKIDVKIPWGREPD